MQKVMIIDKTRANEEKKTICSAIKALEIIGNAKNKDFLYVTDEGEKAARIRAIDYYNTNVLVVPNYETIKGFALQYERGKCQIETISKETREELNNYVNAEFKALERCVKVVFSDNDIDCSKMTDLLISKGILYVSTLYNDSPLFDKDVNIKFRAVHDYIHVSRLFGCDFNGEYQTYLQQSKGLSIQARQVLFSEIVLQASYCLYFGEFAKTQKVVLIDIPNNY